MSDIYNTMGVTIRPDGYGAWNAYRVFMDGGVLVKEEQITFGRSIHYAIRDATQALEMINHGLARGKYDMVVEKPNRVKVT